MSRETDIAIVGAGIIGVAHAYAALSRGLRVAVFERSPRASGASVRNFGLIWPIGQPAGEMHALALRSREIWLNVLTDSRLPHDATGSLHAARSVDEAAVLEEFAAVAPDRGYECEWLCGKEAARRSPALRPDGLMGALWSPAEVTLDPRFTLAGLPDYLRARGVDFHFNTAVTAIDTSTLEAGGETWKASRIIVCGGDDFASLYPGVFASSELVRCKLQMLRTVPQPGGWTLGPALAGGLTLRFYPSFRMCSSLPALAGRIAAEMPGYEHWGIHVMASQAAAGAITLGDSHEYGNDVEIFDKSEIDTLILEYGRSFAVLPDWTIAQRWHGVYAKHSALPWFEAEPAPSVHIVTGTGGAGMTLSFGIAERTMRSIGAC